MRADHSFLATEFSLVLFWKKHLSDAAPPEFTRRYGMAQDSAMVKDFGPESTPWLLNSLLCPYTVQRGQDGRIGENRTWADEFRALQTG
jgi:hypothetical protein